MSLFSGEVPVLGEQTTISGQKLQNVEFIYLNLSASSANGNVFVAPVPYKVVSVTEVHGTAGGAAAAVNLEVIPSGTANGSGSATVLSAAAPLNGTTNTPSKLTLGTGTTIAAGSRLGTVFSGTLTGLANCLVQIGLVRV